MTVVLGQFWKMNYDHECCKKNSKVFTLQLTGRVSKEENCMSLQKCWKNKMNWEFFLMDVLQNDRTKSKCYKLVEIINNGASKLR